MTAVLMVRATIPGHDTREAYGQWQKTDMFPAAIKAFGVKKARRFWSITNPDQHISTFYFGSWEELQKARAEQGPSLKAHADHAWPDIQREFEELQMIEDFTG